MQVHTDRLVVLQRDLDQIVADVREQLRRFDHRDAGNPHAVFVVADLDPTQVLAYPHQVFVRLARPEDSLDLDVLPLDQFLVDEDLVFVLEVIGVVEDVPAVDLGKLGLYPFFDVVLVASPYVGHDLAVVEADQETVLGVEFAPRHAGHGVVQ